MAYSKTKVMCLNLHYSEILDILLNLLKYSTIVANLTPQLHPSTFSKCNQYIHIYFSIFFICFLFGFNLIHFILLLSLSKRKVSRPWILLSLFTSGHIVAPS